MRLIEPLHIPEKGIWSAVGLSRFQFLGIVLVSVLVFLFSGGPAWTSSAGAHTTRIGVSYFIIPVLVALGQWHNGSLRIRYWIEASFLIAVIKLVVTASLFIALKLFVC